jgi:hypothetical protein
MEPHTYAFISTHRPNIALFCAPRHQVAISHSKEHEKDDDLGYLSPDDQPIDLGYDGSSWAIKVAPVNKLGNPREDHGDTPKLLKAIVRDLKRSIRANDVHNFPRVVFFADTYEHLDEIQWYFVNALTHEGERVPDYKKYVRSYYGAMYEPVKDSILKFLLEVDNDLRIIICTNAFGMGVNVLNIRLSVHLWLPGGLEAYVQEFGRLCRLGQSGSAVLYYPLSWMSTRSGALSEHMVQKSKREGLLLKDYVTGLFQSPDGAPFRTPPKSFCRRKFILEVFYGETSDKIPKDQIPVWSDGVCCDRCLLRQVPSD